MCERERETEKWRETERQKDRQRQREMGEKKIDTLNWDLICIQGSKGIV